MIGNNLGKRFVGMAVNNGTMQGRAVPAARSDGWKKRCLFHSRIIVK